MTHANCSASVRWGATIILAGSATNMMAGQRLGYAAQQMGHTVDMFVHTYTCWISDGQSSLEDQKLEQFLALETPGVA